MKVSRVAIAVDVSFEAPGEFEALQEMTFLNKSEIYLVHIFQTTTYTFGFPLSEAALVYPIQHERMRIAESVQKQLKMIGDKNIPKTFAGKIHYQCLFHDNPKKAFCEFIDTHHIDLVLVSSREKRGLFESSFAQFVAGHSKANMIILKHKVSEP